MPRQRWVNLIEHMKDIGKSMMKIKNDDSAVDARYTPGGDLIIGIKSPYWNIDIRYFYRNQDGELSATTRGIKLKFHK